MNKKTLHYIGRKGDLKEMNHLFNILEKNCYTGKGITVIRSKDEEEFILYEELRDYSISLAYKMKNANVKPGDEVIIHSENLKDFLVSLWACFYGGYVALPIENSKNERKQEFIDYVLDNLLNPFILHNNDTEEFYTNIGDRKINLEEINYMDGQGVYEKDKTQDQDELVYIQFSSGSTGMPKGTALTLKNIVANADGLHDAFDINDQDAFLTWQPLTHCYGIVLFHLTPMVAGLNHHFIETEAFMNNPLIWMDKISEHKASITGGIPFAVKHFMTYYDKTNGELDWDLSSLRTITLGAEQVSIELCDKFSEILGRYSVKDSKTVLAPGYGMSETTCVVCVLRKGEKHKGYTVDRETIDIGKEIKIKEESGNEADSTYTILGKSLCNVKTKIVDEEGNDLGENKVGKLLVKGDSVSRGYYSNGEITVKIQDQDGWFDTGDLGFIIKEEIIIVGRTKDMLVVNGVKYIANDIETIISTNIESNYGSVVACNGFSKVKSSEQVYVFVETDISLINKEEKKDFLEYRDKVRNTVFDETGLMIEEVIPIEEMPKAFSGKIKKLDLTKGIQAGEYDNIIEIINGSTSTNNSKNEENNIMSWEEVRDIIVRILEEATNLNINDYDTLFIDYGIVSSNIPGFIKKLNDEIKADIDISAVFNYPNINKLTDYTYMCIYNTAISEQIATSTEDSSEEEKIAIVGMSCRLPGGANSLLEYWDVLINGVDGIVDIPEDRWELERYYDQDKSAPGKMYCKKGGFLDVDVYGFDPKLFNISPKEVAALAPEQRLLLELTLEAYENGNLNINKYKGSNTGVYIGIASNEYSLSHLYSGDLDKIDAYSLTGTCFSTCCGRISYTFGFEGPSLAVDTACSSSLTALHIACNSILNDEAESAVVGGINSIISPTANIGFSKLQATAPDGHCKSFDDSADGYGRAEGGGVLVIKKLSDAIKDNDRIFGVISSTAINQDGKSNGLTAPNGASQEKVIKSALAKAKINPNDVSFIETHGTGTKLGDPIEVNAIGNAYCANRAKDQTLKIGSVKSNIGHLEAGSGIASIIKVLLSLDKNMIPGNLNFNEPNKYIDWDKYPISVVGENTRWPESNGKRYAGVSGFGFGGSNAHIILEDYTNDKNHIIEIGEGGSDLVLKLSAKSFKALTEYAKSYVNFLEGCKEEDIPAIVKTANRSRVDYESRLAVTGKDKTSLINNLIHFINGESSDGVFHNGKDGLNYRKERELIFMFTGQGSQYVGMGRELYEQSKTFAEKMNLCDKLFKPYILSSLVDILYKEGADEERVNKTVNSQPLIFSFEYSLYFYLKECGINPSAVMGHSIGEYPAAVVAGIMSLEDAIQAVSIRSRLMDAAPGKGAMGTLFATEDKVKELINDYKEQVSIATYNAKENIVISGEEEAVLEILEEAKKQNIETRHLRVSHGFHSILMEPIVDDFEEMISGIEFNPPEIDFISSLYGRKVTSKEEVDKKYWSTHIRESVNFYRALKQIEDKDKYVFLEVGSHTVLSSLARLSLSEDAVICPTLSRRKADNVQLANMLAMVYVSGVEIDWSNISFGDIKTLDRNIMLPNYPYERQEFRQEIVVEKAALGAMDKNYDPLLGQKIESPLLKGGKIYQRNFTGNSPHFMSEHVIFEKPISPAAGHISMMLSMIQKIENPLSASLESIEFRVPLAVDFDEERKVQFCIEEAKEDSKSDVSILSLDQQVENSEWLLHAQGKASSSATYFETDLTLDVESLLDLDYDEGIADGVYETMGGSGFELGESFKNIKKSTTNGEVTTCFLEAPKDIPEADSYVIYPGMLDSILQTMLCSIFDELQERDDNHTNVTKTTIIPYFIGKLEFNYREFKNLWCRVKAKIENDIVYGDIDVFNENGELVLRINDSLGKLTNRMDLLKEMNKGYSDLYYHVDWVETKDEPVNNNTDIEYLILSPESKLSEKISNELKSKDLKVYTLPYGIKSKGAVADTQDSWKVFLENFVTSNKSNQEIVFLCPEDNKEDVNIYIRNLYYLTKELINIQDSGKKVKIKVVTANVNSISKKETINLAAAPIWGLSRVVSIEHPEIYQGIIDIDNSSILEVEKYLLAEITSKMEDEVCLRGSKRYVSRMVKDSNYKKDKDNKELVIDTEGAYLITGGTGRIGMVYASKLLERGAKQLVLTCRNEPKQEVLDKIKDLEKQHQAVIDIKYGDINDKKIMEDLIESIKDDGLTIKGIVHCAGVLRDMSLSDMSWNDFEFVLKPKSVGIMNVIDNVETQELDFVLLLSSITSAVGNFGQSNYAAANYFLNALGDSLNHQGIPAYVTCWGPWQDGGMASGKESVDSNMNRMGIFAFDTDTGGEIIDEFLQEPRESVVIADVKWEQFAKHMSGKNKERFFENLAKDDSDNEIEFTEDSDKFLKELGEKSFEERKEILLNKMKEVSAKVMGFQDPNMIDAYTSISEQGADSLMLFTMRTSINKFLDTELNVSIFFNYPSLDELTEYLLDEVLHLSEDEDNEKNSSTESKEEFEKELDEMINEIDNLLD